MDLEAFAEALESIRTDQWGPYRTEILAALRRSARPEVERNAIIEECARVCDILSGLSVQGWGRKATSAARKCASEIRDLKSPSNAALIEECRKALAPREPQNGSPEA